MNRLLFAKENVLAPIYNLSLKRNYSLDMLYCDPSQRVSDAGLGLNALLPPEVLPIEEAVPVPSSSMRTVHGAKEREMLFGRFDPWLKRVMRRYKMTPEAREDAYGDLYCHFDELLDRYDPERGIPLLPYLYRQLGAFLYTHARSGWRRRRRELPFYSDDGAENIGHLTGDPTREWDDRLVMTQVGALLPHAFREIPVRQQRVITMRYCDELAYDEIAERLNIKTATARSLARHGLQSLREWMRKRRIAAD
jgi:RNA polymerase sigma factor (sigma-70 family)